MFETQYNEEMEAEVRRLEAEQARLQAGREPLVTGVKPGQDGAVPADQPGFRPAEGALAES